MVNPAGIFFNSCYSESIYLAFFLAGFYFLIHDQPSPWAAALLFAVTGAIRSNGFLNAGFVAHFQLHSIAQAYYKDEGFDVILIRIISTFGQISLVMAPFITTQAKVFIFSFTQARKRCIKIGQKYKKMIFLPTVSVFPIISKQ